MKKVVIATKNKGKAKEFKDFFAAYDIEAISLLDIYKDIPEIEETGKTFAENARLKAEQIAAILKKPVLADDSGLIIDALNGRPGIFSARYAGEDKSDQANIEKVLYELKEIPQGERTARFICVLAVAIPNEKTIFKTGYCEGVITISQMGMNGFGYDPIFVPTGYSKTMAEISPNEKNRISHRCNAMTQLEEWIKNIIDK